MKFLILKIALLVATVSAGVIKSDGEEDDPIVKGTYQSKLDHFSPQDNRKIELSYSYDPRYSSVGGPIFVLINDGEIDDFQWLEHGLLHDVSRIVNGTSFNVYTRFYGPNNVTSSVSTRELKYLTVEQTVADIAVFIKTIKDGYHTEDSRVILAGSGLGGTLAAWTHQRYPHLVYASWSSSGSFDRAVHTAEPYEALTRVIREHGGPTCAQHVFEAFELVEEKLQEFEIYYIQEIFDLCIYVLPFLEDEMGMFFNGLINYIVDYINVHHMDGLVSFCNTLNQTDANNTLEKIFANWVVTNYGNGKCLEYDYWRNIDILSDEEWDSDAVVSGKRQRLWQQCTQLLTHPTTVNGDTLFGRTISQDYYLNLCSDVFGYEFDYLTSIDAMNNLKIQFGTTDPGTSRAIFTNGEMDINYGFGITEDDDEPDNYVINISHAGQSNDIYELNEEDTTATAAAKFAIHEIMVKWCTED